MLELNEVQARTLIRIVDDDPGVRDSYRFLLEGEGWLTRTYDSAEAFLQSDNALIPGCILLDLRMDGLDGAGLHKKILSEHSSLSVVFVSAHGTIQDAVKALKRGALDFLTKPVDDAVLVEAVKNGALCSLESATMHESESKYEELTDREKAVAGLVAKGALNKQIAIDLGISERTVQIHRANALKKLGVRSSAELAKLLIEIKRF